MQSYRSRQGRVDGRANAVVDDPLTSNLMTSFEAEETQIYDDLVAELRKLDLTANESKILLYLMSHGSCTASDISRFTKIQRTDTYHYLSQLLSKGVVVTTFTKPQKYTSLPFDQAVDSLVKSKYQLLKDVLQAKNDHHSKLEKISRVVQGEEEEISNQYQILGAESVLTRIGKGLEETSKTLAAYFSQKMIYKLYHSDMMDEILRLAGSGVRVRLKTGKVHESGEMMQGLSALDLCQIADPLALNFIIFDDREMMIVFEGKESKDISAVYTNNPALVSTFRYLYDRMA